MGKTFNMVGGGAGVVANPAMTGTETDLQGLEVNGTKYKVPLIRPNLLDNWYFGGGGSQQGGGQFPINQRGNTIGSYTQFRQYLLDRWQIRGGVSSSHPLTVSLDADGLGLSSTIGIDIVQLLESPQRLSGETVTISVAYSLASGSGSINIYDGNYYSGMLSAGSAMHISSKTATLKDSVSELRGYLTINGTGKIYAVKMEIGDTQTLCHNEGTEENPVWVLNEIPNYTEELWKCQRYYQLFASSSYRPTYGEDYRPPMRLHSPSKGTISIGGTTYYYADANL